jgi:phospholipid transport system substrate-binding protein
MLSRRSFVRLLTVAAASAPLATLVRHPALADDGVDLEQARALVSAVAERGLQDVLTAPLPQAQKIERFRALFDTYFDLPSAARFVLGRNWRSASAEEQERFVALFEDINIYTWARRFKDYNGQQLVLAGATPDGPKGAYVETKVEQGNGQPPLLVRWRLRARPDAQFGLLVVDLEVEGLSMALTYRSEYASVIQNNGGSVSALNDILQQQVERLKAEQPA